MEFQKFQELYPNVFPKVPHCGFYPSDGWELLLHDLCKELEEYILKNDIKDFQTEQVKSKYASLTFYTNSLDENINNIIKKYSKISTTICELCGEPGKMITKGYWSTVLCEDCNE